MTECSKFNKPERVYSKQAVTAVERLIDNGVTKTRIAEILGLTYRGVYCLLRPGRSYGTREILDTLKKYRERTGPDAVLEQVIEEYCSAQKKSTQNKDHRTSHRNSTPNQQVVYNNPHQCYSYATFRALTRLRRGGLSYKEIQKVAGISDAHGKITKPSKVRGKKEILDNLKKYRRDNPDKEFLGLLDSVIKNYHCNEVINPLLLQDIKRTPGYGFPAPVDQVELIIGALGIAGDPPEWIAEELGVDLDRVLRVLECKSPSACSSSI